jgi:hypothetical protein
MAQPPNQPTLDELIEFARNYVPTEEEKEEFKRSFAYGNVSLHNPNITRADVDRVAAEMKREREFKNGKQ